MNTEIQSIIRDQFKTLPKVIQDTILNSNWQEKIRRIVTNNHLHVDQGAAIENLVLITMLGIETPEDFVDRAKEYAEVTDEQAYTISSEVEREVFGDIRKKLIEITDTADTVEDIDRTTNELDKVALDIEKEAQKVPLKEKIPVDSFSNIQTAAPSVPKLTKLPPTPTPARVEPANAPTNPPTEQKTTGPAAPVIIETENKEVVPKIVKPIFIPMPKSIQTTPQTPTSTPTEQKTVSKLDPYREPIE